MWKCSWGLSQIPDGENPEADLSGHFEMFKHEDEIGDRKETTGLCNSAIQALRLF